MAAPVGNKFALGADSGRPPAYATPEEFALKASDYFSVTEQPKWTVTGLALHLGFCDKQSLYDYQNKQEFTYLVKYCRSMVEMAYEQKLSSRDVTGAIFALKNMGWRDKSEVDNNHSGAVQLVFTKATKPDHDA